MIDVYWTAKLRGIDPQLAICTEVNSFLYYILRENDVLIHLFQQTMRKFRASSSEVNSNGYSESEEPIKARLQRYPLLI